jgi:hypothetical protein
MVRGLYTFVVAPTRGRADACDTVPRNGRARRSGGVGGARGAAAALQPGRISPSVGAGVAGRHVDLDRHAAHAGQPVLDGSSGHGCARRGLGVRQHPVHRVRALLHRAQRRAGDRRAPGGRWQPGARLPSDPPCVAARRRARRRRGAGRAHHGPRRHRLLRRRRGRRSDRDPVPEDHVRRAGASLSRGRARRVLPGRRQHARADVVQRGRRDRQRRRRPILHLPAGRGERRRTPARLAGLGRRRRGDRGGAGQRPRQRRVPGALVGAPSCGRCCASARRPASA